MGFLLKIPGTILIASTRFYRRVRMYLLSRLFLRVGENVVFDPDGVYSFKTISIGRDVFIGPKAFFSGQSIIIGNKVMFGPGVYILGGDHQYSTVGEYMYDLKRPGESAPVVISDDVWIGANVVILKGVTIGEGSIVGAGSVVVKDVPPYSIVAGNPAQFIRTRFEDRELKRHLELLKAGDK